MDKSEDTTGNVHTVWINYPITIVCKEFNTDDVQDILDSAHRKISRVLRGNPIEDVKITSREPRIENIQ